jgi:hypothetical protein
MLTSPPTRPSLAPPALRPQAKALELYHAAVKQGHFRSPRHPAPSPAGTPTAAAAAAPHSGAPGGALFVAGAGRGELSLHALTAGVATISLYVWLMDLREQVAARGEGCLPASLAVVTDAGCGSKEQGNFIVKEAVATMMAFWGAPFRPAQDRCAPRAPGRVRRGAAPPAARRTPSPLPSNLAPVGTWDLTRAPPASDPTPTPTPPGATSACSRPPAPPSHSG